MGGSDQAGAAQQTTLQDLNLSNQLYGIAGPALSSATGYLTKAYGMGGTLDTSSKYNAMRSNFMDQTANLTGSFMDPTAMGNQLSGRAAGLSGIGVEQAGSAVDEMNKIRSLLSGQGLKTTQMAGAASGLETEALGYMYPGNKTADIIKGAGALGSAIYGGGQQGGWWTQSGGPGDVMSIVPGSTSASIPGMDPNSYSITPGG